MRLLFTFTRDRSMAFISHLDMIRLFLRAFRRVSLPLVYSQGFNPHPRFMLALPLPLGVTAADEYAEVSLIEYFNPQSFIDMMKVQLPEGLSVKEAWAAKPETPSLASLVYAALYRAEPLNSNHLERDDLSISDALARLLASEEIMMKRITKNKKTVYTNVRPFIIEARVDAGPENSLALELLLKAGSGGGVSPFFVLGQIETEPGGIKLQVAEWQVHRVLLYTNKNGHLKPLSEGV